MEVQSSAPSTTEDMHHSDSDEGSEITISLQKPVHMHDENQLNPQQQDEVQSDNEDELLLDQHDDHHSDPQSDNDSAEQTSDSEADIALCPVCKKEVGYGQQGLQCSRCKVWYHSSCCGMSDKRYTALMQEGKEEPWECPAHVTVSERSLRSQSRLQKIQDSTPRKGKPPGFPVHQSP